ncbi:hypothetical protein LTR15_006464 [Elasticomyces elasticus]|nr:hypothetical protein LTR15_006464 [Elasticomyces elasticus]
MGPCPLLQLAPELRNQIFALAVVDTVPLWLFWLEVIGPYIKAKATQPALSYVNRQIRSEALPIFYGQNVFRIYEDFHACAFDGQVNAIIKTAAFKHVISVVYHFKITMFTSLRENKIRIYLDEAGALQYRVEGSSMEHKCGCALHSTLQYLTKPHSSAFGEEEIITPADALLSLHRAVVPSLSRTMGVLGSKCCDCGKEDVRVYRA